MPPGSTWAAMTPPSSIALAQAGGSRARANGGGRVGSPMWARIAWIEAASVTNAMIRIQMIRIQWKRVEMS